MEELEKRIETLEQAVKALAVTHVTSKEAIATITKILEQITQDETIPNRTK